MGTKISAMTAASALDGTELLPIVQGGNNRKATALDIAALAAGVGGGGEAGTTVPNGLVTGGGVFYEGNLVFRVSAATYYIGGTLYSAAEQTVTLTAADGSNPRIDVLALDITGDFVAVAGTAAAAPSEPDIDPATQIRLTFVIVPAAATSLAGVTTTNVYLENTEWTSSSSGTTWALASTNNPYAGTKCVEATTLISGAYVQFDRGAPAAVDDIDTLALFIRSKATWTAGRGLRVQWFAEGVAKGSPVTIAPGYWGFDSATTASYQLLSIPMSQFILPAGTLVDQLRLTDFGGSIGFYLDNIVLQNFGSTAQGPSSGLTQAQGDARYLALTGGTLTGDLIVPDEAYNATNWNGSLEVPTKNAVRDKIEGLGGGSTWGLAGSWTYSSDVANVDFTGLGSYNELLIIGRNLTASASGQRCFVVSVDGGSTFYTTSGNYVVVSEAGVVSNTTVFGIHDTANTGARTLVARVTNTKGDVKACHSNFSSRDILFAASASDINAIRVLPAAPGTAANLTGGTIHVYGR
jgi:hypothetical protein